MPSAVEGAALRDAAAEEGQHEPERSQTETITGPSAPEPKIALIAVDERADRSPRPGSVSTQAIDDVARPRPSARPTGAWPRRRP